MIPPHLQKQINEMADKNYLNSEDELKAFNVGAAVMFDLMKPLVDALNEIVAHEWAADKPKWGNEFVDIAKQALSKIKGDV